MDSRVVCAEYRSLTHEAEDCPHRKQQMTNIANRAKCFQAKVDKLVREGLSSRAQPTVTPHPQRKAAYFYYDDVDDIWMDTIEQMQLPSSSLKPASLSGEETVCLSNVVEQHRLELLRQAEPNTENIHLDSSL